MIRFLPLILFTAACATAPSPSEPASPILYDAAVLVLTNANLIDGTGSPAIKNQSIILRDGTIDWIGADSDLSIPDGATIVDLGGKTVMPGYVMLHEHLFYATPTRQMSWTFPQSYLAAGVTTLRTCGSVEPFEDISIKEAIDRGEKIGPFIDLTSPYVEGPIHAYQGSKRLTSAKEAAEFVRYWADQGMISFKAYEGIDRELLRAFIDAAHERNLKVTGHLCAVTYREAAEMGIDQLEHGFFASTDFVATKKPDECPSEVDRKQSLADLDLESEAFLSFLDALVASGTGITSTLPVLQGLTTTQPKPSDEFLAMLSPDARIDYLKNVERTMSENRPSLNDRMFEAIAKMEKVFVDRGGKLAVGSDPTGNGGTIPGDGNWRALELLVQYGGFTPLQAIQIATLNGAKAMGMEDRIGSIAVGKAADLIIIDGDPSTRIQDIRNVSIVFRNGTGYDSRRIFESVKGRIGFN